MKYSKELIKAISADIANGVPNKYAAIANGISEATFYAWQKEEGPLTEEQRVEFLESIKKAESNRIKNYLNSINRAANEGTWQAGAWYLERVYPEDFGKQREFEIKGDGKVVVTVKDYE